MVVQFVNAADGTGLREYFATSATGIEPVTAAELLRLGATQVRSVAGGVHFSGDLALLYRAHLWLRTASRILRPLRDFAATTPEMLYSQTRRVAWEQFLDPTRTFAVHATVAANPDRKSWIRNSQFAALKVKDALVDRLRREQGARPDVDRVAPDVGVHAHFAGGRCTLSLDASGGSLHERGYRVQATAAPLKETLAAAIIDLTGWDGRTPLMDPMCGSGTLLIEAALRELRIAPGLRRPSFAFERWPDFDGDAWQVIRQEAQAARRESLPVRLQGSDQDPRAVEAAIANAAAAGAGNAIDFTCRSAQEQLPAAESGLIVVNPPYGNRLGDESELGRLYRQLGAAWLQRFPGWTAYVLAGNLRLAREFGLVAAQKTRLYNGPLECRLLRFDLPAGGDEPLPATGRRSSPQ